MLRTITFIMAGTLAALKHFPELESGLESAAGLLGGGSNSNGHSAARS